jgi:hypothetical protein
MPAHVKSETDLTVMTISVTPTHVVMGPKSPGRS